MIEKVGQISDFEDGQVSPESDAKMLEHEHFQIGPFNSLCINSSKKSCFVWVKKLCIFSTED